MSTITFDTYKFIQTLEAAGVERRQAEAFSSAFKDASGEAELVTKRDFEKFEARFETKIKELDGKFEAKFEKLDGKLTLIQWMLALIVAADVAPVLIRLFHSS